MHDKSFLKNTHSTTESSTSNANTNTDVSAEDALNSHAKKMSLRNEAFNKARTAHMKAFQAQFTKDQQVHGVIVFFC